MTYYIMMDHHRYNYVTYLDNIYIKGGGDCHIISYHLHELDGITPFIIHNSYPIDMKWNKLNLYSVGILDPHSIDMI